MIYKDIVARQVQVRGRKSEVKLVLSQQLQLDILIFVNFVPHKRWIIDERVPTESGNFGKIMVTFVGPEKQVNTAVQAILHHNNHVKAKKDSQNTGSGDLFYINIPSHGIVDEKSCFTIVTKVMPKYGEVRCSKILYDFDKNNSEALGGIFILFEKRLNEKAVKELFETFVASRLPNNVETPIALFLFDKDVVSKRIEVDTPVLSRQDCVKTLADFGGFVSVNGYAYSKWFYLKDSVKYSTASSKLILVGFDVQIEGLSNYFCKNTSKRVITPRSSENFETDRKRSRSSGSSEDAIEFISESTPLKNKNRKKQQWKSQQNQNSKKWNKIPQTSLRNNFSGENSDSEDILAYINNLPMDVSKEEMERKFAPFGLTGVKLARDIDSKDFLGYGFITVRHNRDFVALAKMFDGSMQFCQPKKPLQIHKSNRLLKRCLNTEKQTLF